MPGSVLFLCSMNVIRSPIAEQLARHLLPRGIYVASAGVRTGEPDPFAAEVLREVGLSPCAHPSQALEEMEDVYFDLIVTLAPDAHHAALELTRSMAVDVEYWPVPDPSVVTGNRDQKLAAYRGVLQMLEARIAARFAAPPPPRD